MPSCVVKWCKNNSTSRKKSDGITFHCIPKDEERRNAWVEVLRRSRYQKTWLPSECTLVCSSHFEACDFYTTTNGLRRLSKSAIPKKDLFHPAYGTLVIVEPDTTLETSKPVQLTTNCETSEHASAFDITIKSEPIDNYIIEQQSDTQDPLPDSREDQFVYTAPFPETERNSTADTPSPSVSKKKPRVEKRPLVVTKEQALVDGPNIRNLKEKLKKSQTKLKNKDIKIKLLNQTVRRLTKKIEKLREKLRNSKPENYVDISLFIT